MAENNKKLFMEMQMDELKDSLEETKVSSTEEENIVIEEEKKPLKKKKRNYKTPENAELAKLYEDAAEYEAELESFEDELEVINANKLKDIVKVLTKQSKDKERDYAQELKEILVAMWTHFVQVDKSHPAEQLELIKATEFSAVAEKLTATFPDFSNDFEKMVRDVLVNRLKMLIEIKKEHIEQEIEEIYIAGLKPSFVKRIYKQYHGIS